MDKLCLPPDLETEMGWKEVAAGLGTETTIGAIQAAKDRVTKRQYKRIIATTVAQLLELHPDFGPRKARRRARRLTGAKPSKKLMSTAENPALSAGGEAAVAASDPAGLAEVAGIAEAGLVSGGSGPDQD